MRASHLVSIFFVTFLACAFPLGYAHDTRPTAGVAGASSRHRSLKSSDTDVSRSTKSVPPADEERTPPVAVANAVEELVSSVESHTLPSTPALAHATLARTNSLPANPALQHPTFVRSNSFAARQALQPPTQEGIASSIAPFKEIVKKLMRGKILTEEELKQLAATRLTKEAWDVVDSIIQDKELRHALTRFMLQSTKENQEAVLARAGALQEKRFFKKFGRQAGVLGLAILFLIAVPLIFYTSLPTK
ncbi:hypothetical protein PsorP6_015559 [Peronosclerospora sorghi]|uniref:Uncharacterized protein n=1 Tax=Peronosclerospora sorghi TaxID=230839 RepID=A0ACC0WRD4_9STRA|nr:hypothetical protein PsorP6_015559 [Peronosclerospora sorghi]